MAAYQPLRQPVTQPTAGASENFHILGHQPNLFVQLAEQCLLGALVTLDATLRKLPGLLTDTPGPQHLPQPIGQDDAYIRSEERRVGKESRTRRRPHDVTIYEDCI